jgi:Cys-rich protein (TIGR01571 family)
VIDLTQRDGLHRAIALADNIPLPTHFDTISVLRHDEWRDTVCHWCCQIYPTCLCSVICPCILVGQVAETIVWHKSITLIMSAGLAVALLIVCIVVFQAPGLILFIFLVLFSIAFQLRTNLRRILRLPGGPCSDCCLSCCCPWCVIAQATRHVFIFRSACDCLPWRVTEPPPPLPIASVNLVPIEICTPDIESLPPPPPQASMVRTSSRINPAAIPQAYFVSQYSHVPSYSYNR